MRSGTAREGRAIRTTLWHEVRRVARGVATRSHPARLWITYGPMRFRLSRSVPGFALHASRVNPIKLDLGGQQNVRVLIGCDDSSDSTNVVAMQSSLRMSTSKRRSVPCLAARCQMALTNGTAAPLSSTHTGASTRATRNVLQSTCCRLLPSPSSPKPSRRCVMPRFAHSACCVGASARSAQCMGQRVSRARGDRRISRSLSLAPISGPCPRPARCAPAYAAANCSKTAKTSSSCVLGVTFGMTCATTPSGPMMKVARRAPKYFRPYIDIPQGRGRQPLIGEQARRASCIVRTVTVSRLSSYS